MAIDWITLFLSIPFSIAANLNTDKVRKLFGIIKNNTPRTLFMDTFYAELDEKKEYGPWVNKLKKAIQQDEPAFLLCFAFPEAGYADYIDELQSGDFYSLRAKQIVDHFAIPDDDKNIAHIVLTMCLENWLDQFRPKVINTLMPTYPALFNELTGHSATQLATWKQPPLKTKKERQIKILAITASPENGADLLYEREQDILLDMFAGFDHQEVFLDMPDPVKSSLTEIQENLQHYRHDILLISAHGGVNKNGAGFLALEGPQGEEVQVTGTELLAVLDPKPQVVILSACFSAQQQANLLPVAEALYKGGVKTVIGMKDKISHLAAIDFNQGFFKALAANKTVQQAFAAGKAEMVAGEQKRCRENPGWQYLNEDQVPHMQTGQGGLTRRDFSALQIHRPEPPKRFDFKGAQYLDRGFIGRRQYLRKIYNRIEQGVGALLLKGPGGIGKSTLTTRATAQLKNKDYDFMVIQGETSPAGILDALAKKAGALGIENAAAVYAAEARDEEKLQWFLENLLSTNRMVVILDNFEDNQAPELEGEFLKEDLKVFLRFFREGLTGLPSVLLFSSRYTVPGIETINLGEFSRLEFRKRLLNGRALHQLDGPGVERLAAEIGGNPRAVELLDAIAYEEFNNGGFTWLELTDLLPELRERLISEKEKEDYFTPLFLDRLLGYLSPGQKQGLEGLSIYRLPVGEVGLEAQGLTLARKDRRKLEDLSLLEFSSPLHTYYVHRLTAQYVLAQMVESARTEGHQRAAEYYEGIKDEEGAHVLDDLIESRWHYIQAGEWNQAAEITFALEEYLTLHGYWQMSFQLVAEIAENGQSLSEKNRSIVDHLLGMLYQGFGDYEKALAQYRKSLEIDEKLGDIPGVSTSLHQIGMIYQEKGDYDEALAQYRKSLEMCEKLGDIPGVANSSGQIGMIYQEKGDYDEALAQYRKSLEMFEKLGDIRGVSTSLHNIGAIYQDKGDYDEALAQYRKSLEMKEKLGDIPGVALSLAQMGVLNSAKNNFPEALALFIQAFQIFKKLGSPNAERVATDIARVREKMPEEQFNAIVEKWLGGQETEATE